MLFPITCVDNFYSDPDIIREYALSLDYTRDNKANYPGTRTERLHITNPLLFDIFCKKLFSLFYNFEKEEIKWIVDSNFQKIYPYDCCDSNKQNVNSGWVHKDVNNILAGVIYLNPIPNLNSGTSIYESNENHNKKLLDLSISNNYYNNNKKNLTEDEYVKEKIEHDSKFYKTLEIKNVYNRMISYDASYWHGQSGFLIDSEDFRLTQVFFVKSIECTSTPYLRCKEYEF